MELNAQAALLLVHPALVIVFHALHLHAYPAHLGIIQILGTVINAQLLAQIAFQIVIHAQTLIAHCALQVTIYLALPVLNVLTPVLHATLSV